MSLHWLDSHAHTPKTYGWCGQTCSHVKLMHNQLCPICSHVFGHAKQMCIWSYKCDAQLHSHTFKHDMQLHSHAFKHDMQLHSHMFECDL